jgi:alkanesulfonate monooxygenase SsuD/methylene tetrahydromethanopterin reductase-like flavin-dependent oxidoreductase (luciferase family)
MEVVLKIGVYHALHNLGHKREFHELLDETRQMAIYCDEAGFDNFWLGEHHFSIWGREMLSNPILFGADIAARTSRITIGLSAVVAPFWHPLRLAEDLALLDQISRGRLEIGLARGNYGLEALNLNPNADPNDPAKNQAVFDETVDILKASFTQDRFSYHGKYYTVPRPGFVTDRAHTVTDENYIDPGTGELIKLSIYPKPYQRPMPPLWQVVDSPKSIEYAAGKELGIIMWRPTIATLKERFSLYQKAAQKAGRNLPFGARTGLLRDTFVAKTNDEARRIAHDAVMGNLNFSNWRGPSIYLNPGETLPRDEEAALKKKLTYEFVAPRSLLFGSPDDVLNQIRTLRDETNLEQLSLKVNWVGLGIEETMRSLHYFGEHILPELRRDEELQTAPKSRAHN